MMKRKTELSEERLSALFYQLALMTRAGIGAEEALFLILEDAGEEERAGMKAAHDALVRGEALSEGMRASGLFPAYALHMLHIGEMAGKQEEVFEALSNFYRREHGLKQAVRQAVVYPAVMAVLIAAVFLVLVGRVLPVFSGVFGQMGLTLSPVAAALLRLGDVSKYLAAALAAVLLVATLAVLILYRRGALRETNIVRGKSAASVARSRFASAMALMLSSGLPIDDAVAKAKELLEGSALAGPIGQCADKLREGESFPQAAESCKLFPALETGLLKAGFRAGLGDQAMEELARRSQEEAEEGLSRFLGRFQYGLVIVLCAAVGLVLLSVMLPLIGVLSAIGG